MWKWFERQKNAEIAAEVKRCFDDVEWTRHSFNFNGTKAKTENGDTLFYPSQQIDDAIKKLNGVLEKLSTQTSRHCGRRI